LDLEIEQKAVSSSSPVAHSNRPSKIKTGIRGLDSLMEGGLAGGSFHIIAGGPGTGKTLLCGQLAYNVASDASFEGGAVYVTFEETAEFLTRNLKFVGIDLAPLFKTNRLRLLDLYTIRGEGLDGLFGHIVETIEEINAKVLILDSLTAFLAACNTDFEIRTFMKRVEARLKELGVTTIATLSVRNRDNLGLEAFIADSVMYFENKMQEANYVTQFAILKMRGVDHSRRFHRVLLTTEGVSISSG
jgi:circadian clock protein KaiC